MKKQIAVLVAAILFAATAQAGQGPIIGDVAVTDLGGGITRVTGSMTGVRFTDDDLQQIGCSISSDRFATPFLRCFARDINANNHFCFSWDPALIEAAKSISPYSLLGIHPMISTCSFMLMMRGFVFESIPIQSIRFFLRSEFVSTKQEVCTLHQEMDG